MEKESASAVSILRKNGYHYMNVINFYVSTILLKNYFLFITYYFHDNFTLTHVHIFIQWFKD